MKHALSTLIALTVLVGFAGCGHGLPRTGGQVSLVEEAQPTTSFLIKRTTLEHALAQGAGWFIRQVGVRPVITADDKFFGYQLTALFPNRAPESAPLPVRVGDIVQMVNGHPIERPEQFMEVWHSMASESYLSLHIVRDHQQLLVTWVIRDDRPAPAVSAVDPLGSQSPAR